MNNDKKWLKHAIELSKKCPTSDKAFSVGAVIVDSKGNLIAEGFSRETDPKIHAEESALQKVPLNTDLSTCKIYSSLEPCGKRLSAPIGCAELIIEAGIKHVVFAANEPSIFVPGDGDEMLHEAGVKVDVISELTPDVINAQSSFIQRSWKNN